MVPEVLKVSVMLKALEAAAVSAVQVMPGAPKVLKVSVTLEAPEVLALPGRPEE